MKIIKFLLNTAFLCTFGFFFFVSGCVRDHGIRADMSYINLKAVSLRELQKKIIQGNEQDINAIKSFYGITQLYGFLWDTEGKDLILFGEAEKTKATLYFDDFVVSLKNAYYLYCKKEGNTIYYSDPSCTIDPDPNTMNSLDKLNNYDFRNDPDMKGRSWEEICTHPQSVGVFGIPFNSHLASLMVNADYIMKDITNGNLKIDIEGDFKSLHQIRREIVEESTKNRSSVNLGPSMNRFEFTAPNAYFRNSEHLYLHYSQPIVLITEEEYLSENSISGTGNPDPLAKKFADNFSSEYQKISKVLPVYESLLQSYRIFAIAKAIEESHVISDTSFFSEIFHHYPLDKVYVPSSLPGKSMIDQVNYKTDEAYYTHYLYSCGGVNLGTKVQKSAVNRMKEMEIINSIIHARPGSEAVEWNSKKIPSNYWILNINRLDLLLKMSPLIN
jgi:hypothetical protein